MENFDKTFNCSGKVNYHDWRLNESGFFMKKDLNIALGKDKPRHDTTLNIFKFDTRGICVLLDLQHYNRYFESNLKQFERYEKVHSFHEKSDSDKSTDFYALRKLSCEFVYHLRNYMIHLKTDNVALKDINDTVVHDLDDLLSTIQRFLNRIKNISASTFLYVSSSSGNKCNQPEYHMYHIHLDLRWLLVTLISVKNYQWEDPVDTSEDMNNYLHNITGDLIYISMKIFESTSNEDLNKRTPYSCTCTRELWLMLQVLTDELEKSKKSKSFWDYVNGFLNESLQDVPQDKKYRHLSNCKKPELFCIWLIYHLTVLYAYERDGSYIHKPSDRYQELQQTLNTKRVEKVLKAYVARGAKEDATIDEELGIIIPLLQVLCIHWWKSDFQLIAMLFECFHKRLDKPFLLQNRGPWVTSSEKKTPKDVLNNVRDRLKGCETSDESSFGLFLRLLGVFLREKCANPESRTWILIKGRILSKFQKDKLTQFSQSGIYNFISLYLTLAVSVDISIATIMVKFLPDSFDWMDSESGKKYCLIWKSMLTVLLLYHERKLSIKEIAPEFTKAADKISCCKDEFSKSMMVWFVEVLRILLSQNNHFECDEHELLGGWIDRYLSEIPPNRNAVFMSTIFKTWKKCSSAENRHITGNSLMRFALWCHLISRIRLMLNIDDDFSTNFYEIPTKLAADFTIEICRDPKRYQNLNHSPVKLFQHFTASIILKDLRSAKLYLSLFVQDIVAVDFLKKEKDIKDFDLLCIQLWIKFSILTTEDNEQDQFLKNYVANLLVTKEIMNCQADYDEFLQSSEPLKCFLVIVSKKRNTFQSEREQIMFDHKCKSFIFGIDKWILHLAAEENKDSKLSIWTYQCIGLVIKCWAPILYSKDPSNMLKTIVNKIALPPKDNKSNLSYREHLSQKIFSMIILGFENLNVATDISLQHLMRELFERYLPLLITHDDKERCFKISDAILDCFLAKLDFTKFIFNILGSMITVPADQTTHAACYLVMFLLTNFIKAGAKYSMEMINSIVNECGERIFNCYCLVHDSHPHKKHTMDFLQTLTASSYYEQSYSMREKLKAIMWNAFKKNTISHSSASFDLLNFTARINKDLFQYLYTRMEAFVTICEKKQLSNAGTLRFQINSVKKNHAAS